MQRSLLALIESDEYLAQSLSSAHDLSKIVISGISSSSLACMPGFLFVAKKGASKNSCDGHNFIDEAISRGASCVVVDEQWLQPSSYSLPIIRAQQSSKALAHLCEAFWDFPSKKLKLIGLTGTNGKTSTSFMLHSIIQAAGARPTIMGTLGQGDPGALVSLSHTTMEAEYISKALAKLVEACTSHVILEVSSHGLVLDRVCALDFFAVGLSNITQDHLDFHESMSAYILAKQKLFDQVAKAHTYKILPRTNSFAQSVQSLPNIRYYDPMLKPKGLRLPGEFQAHNASLASALALSLGISQKHIERGLARCLAIPGRLQHIPSRHCQIYVDFAHTPDALRAALESARKLSRGRVIVVFGAGGERDFNKRPLMGHIAQSLADMIIVTDDNPRFEDPSAIRADIFAGIPATFSAKHEIGDRKSAIKMAIRSANPDDLVLIAGKGAENYQIYGDERREFCDAIVVRQILELL